MGPRPSCPALHALMIWGKGSLGCFFGPMICFPVTRLSSPAAIDGDLSKLCIDQYGENELKIIFFQATNDDAAKNGGNTAFFFGTPREFSGLASLQDCLNFLRYLCLSFGKKATHTRKIQNGECRKDFRMGARSFYKKLADMPREK